jgi:hypothetical protein
LSSERDITLKCDEWICYSHKLFNKMMFTRIVEVRNSREQRLVVENGEILEAKDQIRVLEKQADGSYDSERGSSFKAVQEYKYQLGTSRSLQTLHQKADSRAAQGKLAFGAASNFNNSTGKAAKKDSPRHKKRTSPSRSPNRSDTVSAKRKREAS